MRNKTRRSIIFIAAGLVALVSAGIVIGSQLAAPPSPEALEAATRTAPMIPLAQIAAGNGKPARGVFAQVAAGQFCLWDASSAQTSPQQGGGGCNPADDPLGGRLVSASLAYDGGPAAQNVTDARLIGIAQRSVHDVQVLMSDGSRRKMPLHAVSVAARNLWVFGYRFAKKDLANGIGPTAVLALDAKGAEVDRQATGFGG